MNTTNEIKAGDIIYRKTYSFGRGIEKLEVTKVTPKGAIRLDNGVLITSGLRKKGDNSWSHEEYLLATEELEKEYLSYSNKAKLQSELKNLEVDELSDEDVLKILDVIQQIKENA